MFTRWLKFATVISLLLMQQPAQPVESHTVFLPLLITYTPPPPDYHIAFVSTRDGSHDIYTMRPDGSDLRQITNDDNYEYFLAWSPDASRIVYTVQIQGKSGHDLYIVDVSDGTSVPLTDEDEDAGSPDWSPNGSTIAYNAYNDGVISIFLIDSDGSNRRRITPLSASFTDPRWSPDGQWIVAIWDENLVAFSADGEDAALLLPSNDSIIRGPAWDPYMSQVAYVEDIRFSDMYCIKSLVLDGLWSRVIHCQPDSLDALDWSPDGTRILYTRCTDVGDLFIKDVTGPGLIQLTDAVNNGSYGRWSPIKLP